MDRIRLNDRKYRLSGTSERWRAYRRQAIVDITEHWKENGKYFEFSGRPDYFQLYDSWSQNDIYSGRCRFVMDAGDEHFTICHVGEPAESTSEVPFDDFDELIESWRAKLVDLTIEIRAIRLE